MNKIKIVAVFILLINSYTFSQVPKSLNDGIKTALPANVDILTDKLQQLDSAILKNDFKNITSILIARHGKLVYEKYYNGFTDTTLHNTRSATKTITSMLIGLAIDQKFIPSEQTTVFSYFQDKKPIQNPDARKEKIAIEDLLTMSSLLECDDENQFSSGNEERMYVTEDYIKFALDLPIKGFPAWTTKPKDSPYGRSFSYCTAGAVLLGGVIERSTKMKVDAFAKKYLFDPLEILKPTWQITPLGMPMTGGGLLLKSRDFLKLALLYNNKGIWNGKQIISDNWITKSVTPHAEARENTDYGYFWWIQKFGTQTNNHLAYYMAGNGGSKIAVVPDLDLVIVLTANWYGTGKAHQQSEKIISDYILPAIIK